MWRETEGKTEREGGEVWIVEEELNFLISMMKKRWYRSINGVSKRSF